MTFDPYDPRDRRLNGRSQLASWLISGALILVLALTVPHLGIGGEVGQLASSAPAVEDCAV